MINEFTVVLERDEDWYVAYCLEVPEANGQGKTKAAARENVAQAIALMLDFSRENGRRELPPEAVEEVLVIEYPPEKGRIKLDPEAAQQVIAVAGVGTL